MQIKNCQLPGLYRRSCQASWTTSSHCGSRSHIALNLNNLTPSRGWNLTCGNRKARKEWSDVDIAIWCKVAPWNLACHSLFAKAQSNLTLICPSSPLFFYHVNGCPTKPRSRKALECMTLRNLSICLASLILPPTFSELPVVSLKSPMQNQEIWLLYLKD